MVAQEKTTQNDHQQQRDEEYYSPSFIEAEGEDQEYEDFDLRPQHFARRRQCRVTTTVLGILVLAGIGTGTYFALSRNSAVAVRMVEAPQTAAPATTNSTAVSDGTSSSSSTNSTASDGITLEQVGVHNTADDCWHAIQGTVYDLTSYAPEHPGGDFFITSFCGKDSTVDYAAVHEPVLLVLASHLIVGPFADTKQIASAEPMDAATTSPSLSPTRVSSIAPTAVSSSRPSVKPLPSPTTGHPTTSPSQMPLNVSFTVSSILGNLTETILGFMVSPTQSPGGEQQPTASDSPDIVEVVTPTASPGSRVTPGPTKSSTNTPIQQTTAMPVIVGGVIPTSNPVIRATPRPTELSTKIPTQAPQIAPTRLPIKAPTDSPVSLCISLAEVGNHKLPNDCWLILEGDVYDLTTYLDRHPGGSSIIESQCGTDATAVYSIVRNHTPNMLQTLVPELLLSSAC